MPKEAKQALENLSKNANSLTPEQLQRLGDIAYGMSLVKEAQPKKEAYDQGGVQPTACREIAARILGLEPFISRALDLSELHRQISGAVWCTV